MYIANPFKRRGQRGLSDLTSTHPPISERIRILRSMAQGASFRDYARAFTAVTHTRNIIPAAALTDEEVGIRESRTPPTEPAPVPKQVHQMGDLMRKVNGFSFLTCPCGLKLKIPPNFRADTVRCPRCSRTLPMPRAAGKD
jgi:heat shock protein HtpX